MCSKTTSLELRRDFDLQNDEKNFRKITKNRFQNVSENRLGSRHPKKPPKKPVLASEREARSSLRNVGARQDERKQQKARKSKENKGE